LLLLLLVTAFWVPRPEIRASSLKKEQDTSQQGDLSKLSPLPPQRYEIAGMPETSISRELYRNMACLKKQEL
jgi:hypothetical protein